MSLCFSSPNANDVCARHRHLDCSRRLSQAWLGSASHSHLSVRQSWHERVRQCPAKGPYRARALCFKIVVVLPIAQDDSMDTTKLGLQQHLLRKSRSSASASSLLRAVPKRDDHLDRSEACRVPLSTILKLKILDSMPQCEPLSLASRADLRSLARSSEEAGGGLDKATKGLAACSSFA